MTRCKYCRVELVLGQNARPPLSLGIACGDACYWRHECLDRMRDRERRIVRVYYRVRDDKGHEVMAEDWRPDAMRWKHRGFAVFKVTVRRKAKP